MSAKASPRSLCGDRTRTAMYRLVPVNVPATEFISSPETPKSQSLTTPSRVRRTFGGLMSRWIVLRECRYASPCRICNNNPARSRQSVSSTPNRSSHTRRRVQQTQRRHMVPQPRVTRRRTLVRHTEFFLPPRRDETNRHSPPPQAARRPSRRPWRRSRAYASRRTRASRPRSTP